MSEYELCGRSDWHTALRRRITSGFINYIILFTHSHQHSNEHEVVHKDLLAERAQCSHQTPTNNGMNEYEWSLVDEMMDRRRRSNNLQVQSGSIYSFWLNCRWNFLKSCVATRQIPRALFAHCHSCGQQWRYAWVRRNVLQWQQNDASDFRCRFTMRRISRMCRSHAKADTHTHNTSDQGERRITKQFTEKKKPTDCMMLLMLFINCNVFFLLSFFHSVHALSVHGAAQPWNTFIESIRVTHVHVSVLAAAGCCWLRCHVHIITWSAN